jgi:hypothetical protein
MLAATIGAARSVVRRAAKNRRRRGVNAARVGVDD